MSDFQDEPWHPARGRRRLLIAAVIAAAVVAAWFGYWRYDRGSKLEEWGRMAEANKEANKELDGVRDEIKKVADARTKAWRAGINAASTVIADPDAKPCPVAIPKTALTSVEMSLERLGLAHSNNSLPSTIVLAKQVKTSWSPSAGRLMNGLTAIRLDTKNLEGKRERAKALLHAATEWTTDLTVVIETEEKAGSADFDAGTFHAGIRMGRAYVYDYEAAAVVCLGEFQVSNSGVLEVDTSRLPAGRSFEVIANFDLDKNTAEVALESLRAYTQIAQ